MQLPKRGFFHKETGAIINAELRNRLFQPDCFKKANPIKHGEVFKMNILFINGSPNKHGNTAKLAELLLDGNNYETLNLTDYKLYSYGQNFADDQFEEILAKMKAADILVIGSPVYWHNMCGAVRNLLDRFYGPVSSGSLAGKKLAFVFQGAAPEAWMLEKGEYTMNRFARLYGMEYAGMVTRGSEAKARCV